MNQADSDSADNLDEIIGSSFENVYDGDCQYNLCDQQGSIYRYPSKDSDSKPKTVIACERHIKEFGFCYSCDKFARNDLKFHETNGRLCNECWRNHWSDWNGGYGWNDDDWEDLHNG